MAAAALPSRAGRRGTVGRASPPHVTTPRLAHHAGTVPSGLVSARCDPVTRRPAVTVVGSINQDMVARVPRLPGPGQTVLGHDLVMVPGGKGLNQAVAAARAGAITAFVGMVGDDSAGQHLLAVLDEEGVDTRGVATVGALTGRALISVADDGENHIVVVPGANAGGERRPRGPPPRAGRTGAGGPGAARDPARRRRGRPGPGRARPASRPSSTPLPRSRSTPRCSASSTSSSSTSTRQPRWPAARSPARPKRRTPAGPCGGRAAVSWWSRWAATAPCW